MSIQEMIGTARAQLEDAQVWARVASTHPVVVVPSRDKEQPPTEVDAKSAAVAQLRRARATIDAAIAGLR